MTERAGRADCRICGGPTTAVFSTYDFNRHISNERFEYVRCDRCHTLSLANPPADLGAYYPADYYSVPRTRAEVLALVGDTERAKLALLKPFAPGGRLVEIGPAIGGFVAVAKEAGYSAEAIEMDPECCRFLEGELGVPTTCSDTPEDVLAARGGFDVIALWQVVEHLPDPAGLVRAASRALAPGGVLAIAAPNPDALQLRLLRGRWTHIDAPRHLSLIPIPALVGLARQHGLEPVLVTTNDASGLGWNAFGWRESFANAVTGARARSALRMAGSAVERTLAPVERRGRRGTSYTVLLRQPIERD